MRQVFALLTVAAVSLAVVGLSASGDAAKGKELFTKKCQMCHAADGSGTPAMLKKYTNLKPLGSPDIQKLKDDELIKGFKEAEAHKALVGSTSDADLANAIAHIRSFKK